MIEPSILRSLWNMRMLATNILPWVVFIKPDCGGFFNMPTDLLGKCPLIFYLSSLPLFHMTTYLFSLFLLILGWGFIIQDGLTLLQVRESMRKVWGNNKCPTINQIPMSWLWSAPHPTFQYLWRTQNFHIITNYHHTSHRTSKEIVGLSRITILSEKPNQS